MVSNGIVHANLVSTLASDALGSAHHHSGHQQPWHEMVEIQILYKFHSTLLMLFPYVKCKQPIDETFHLSWLAVVCCVLFRSVGAGLFLAATKQLY